MRQYQPRPFLHSQGRQSPPPKQRGKGISPLKTSFSRQELPAGEQSSEPSASSESTRQPGRPFTTIPILPPGETETRGDVSARTIHRAAEQGRYTPVEPLPHIRRLQASFGHHDLSGIQAHAGPQASLSARSMQATAFTSGEHVVFANPPDLRVAAHEAAHVVQQRHGVQLSGGIGTVGDRYEQQAEDVARRVASGQSVEKLLDHSSPLPMMGRSTGMAVQRIRAGLNGETQQLNSDEEQQQKALFSLPAKAATRKKGKKEQVELNANKVDQKLLSRLSDQLIKLAMRTNREYDREAASYTGSPGNDLEKTPYYKVLELAIDKALGQYGPLLQGALKEKSGKGPGPLAPVAQNPLDKGPIGLKRSQQIYDALSPDEKEGEARAAIQYVIANNKTVGNFIKQSIMPFHEKALSADQELDIKSVEAAYVDALLQQKDKKVLVEELSMQRARHGPQTRDSTIYIQTKGKEDKTSAWTLYRQLVHEAIHTAAHSNFEAYLNRVPEELRNTINEGTVDYFATQVWLQVAKQLQANKGNPEYATIHGIIDPPEAKADQITEGDVEVVQHYAATPLYANEVKTIERAVGKLGEDRLKAAFFYGDVNHFFPTFEQAMDIEEKPMEEAEALNTLESESGKGLKEEEAEPFFLPKDESKKKQKKPEKQVLQQPEIEIPGIKKQKTGEEENT